MLREKLLVQNFRDKEILARLTTSLEETLKDLSNKESKRTSEGSEVINEDLCNTIKTDQKLEVSKIVNDCGLQLSDNLCKLDLGKQSNQLIDINKSDQVESNSDQRQELNFNEISSNVKKELKSESEKLIHLGDGDS